MTGLVCHIIDDDPEIRESTSFLLSTEGIESTTHASSEAFLQCLPELKPGCILLDIRMPGMNGLELQKHLRAHGHRLPVVVLTGHGDVETAVSAMKEGACDFLQKPFSHAELVAAVKAACSEMPASMPESREACAAREAIAMLTPRELQVLCGLVRGSQNKVIAYELGISPRTVELYRANAMRKLAARSLSEMLHLAFLAGIDGHHATG